MSGVNLNPNISIVEIFPTKKNESVENKIQEPQAKLSSDSMNLSKTNGKLPNGSGIFFQKMDSIPQLKMRESYPENFVYSRPNCEPSGQYPPVYDDPFNNNFTEPVTTDEMRYMYKSALMNNNGYALLRLAKVENEKQLLPDVKAGDILFNAYQVGSARRDPNLLLHVAKYENEANLMDMKAGDVLQDAFDASKSRRDARTMLSIASYENTVNIMDAKAGDILYEAYSTAKNNRNSGTMFRIADFEQENDIMKMTAEQIRNEAIHMGPGYPY